LIVGWVEQVVETGALAALATSYKCVTALGLFIGVYVDVMLDFLNLSTCAGICYFMISRCTVSEVHPVQALVWT